MNVKNNLTWLKHADFILIDLICLMFSFILSYYLKFGNFGVFISQEWTALFVITCSVNIIITILLSLYSGIIRRRYYEQIVREIPAYFYQIVIICILFYVLKIGTLFSREMLIETYLMYYISANILKYARKRQLLAKDIGYKKTKLLVIGSRATIEDVIHNILVGDIIEYEIKYIYLIDSDATRIKNIPIIKKYQNREIEEVFIATYPSELPKEMYKYFIDNGICMHFCIESMIGQKVENSFVQRVGNYNTLSVDLFSYDANKMGYFILKRLLDILFGILGTIAMIPFAIILKICYMISGDFKSIFYTQRRVGKNGKIINIYKFRSMVYNSDEILEELLKDKKYRDEWEKNQKFENDPRITKVGNVIRKLSIDEMPQFLNILKGDMSLIGPRPLVEGELEMHDGLQLYTKVKPGISGWWACNGRSNIEYTERLELEYYYVQNCSIKLDLMCILRTIYAIVRRDGAQ